jgi:hypothetical protein
MILTGENRRAPRKVGLSAILSATNPTWTELGAERGLRDETPAINRLSYGAAWSGSQVRSFGTLKCTVLLSTIFHYVFVCMTFSQDT